jgi:hemoglobin-like flavoprotein
MGLQKKVLEKSFYRLMVFYATNAADDYLEHIAIRHSKTHLNIAPVLYDLWLESLVETLKTFDPDFNREVELAWRLVLAPGIAYMKFYYDH